MAPDGSLDDIPAPDRGEEGWGRGHAGSVPAAEFAELEELDACGGAVEPHPAALAAEDEAQPKPADDPCRAAFTVRAGGVLLHELRGHVLERELNRLVLSHGRGS